MKRFHKHLAYLALTVAATVLALPRPALGYAYGPTPGSGGSAVASDEVPEELEGVGITEKLDAQVPLDLTFTNSEGEKVQLGDYFDGERPVILTLVYYECPMLCGLALNGTVRSLEPLEWTPGDEYELITVSFNHQESPTLAKLKKQQYVKKLGKPGAAEGWHFLTGDEESIRKLTEAVGFGFKWNEARQEYAHTTALILLTPEGHVSRYLRGITYEPKTVKLSLVEASDGKVGSTVDQLVLYCFHYDPEEGTYTAAAMNIMKLGGVLTVIALSGLIGTLWFFGNRRKSVELPDDASA